MIVRSYSRNKPCIRPEHIIRLSSTHHLSALNISSESSELFVQKHPSFSSKPPGFSKQMPAIPLAEVED